jgi:hypothetical protein
MSDLSGFFAAIERALFEVATWVILIPKTLYLVLSHPGKVPEYVKGELRPRDDGSARFQGIVSPLLLFLLVALGPLLLVQVIQLPKAPIEGASTGNVGTESRFRVDFADIPDADSMRITWSIERADTEWGEFIHDETHCYEYLQRLDCGQARFMELVDEGKSADEAMRVIIAEGMDPSDAQEIYGYWCSPPPGRGCDPGSDQDFDEDFDEGFDQAFDQFHALIDGGSSADAARQAIAEDHGLDTAREIYDYWCSPPLGRGCSPAFDRASDQFAELIEAGNSADAARQAVAEDHGIDTARELYDYWCSPPPGSGCDPAYDRFVELRNEGTAEQEALDAISREFSPEAAAAVSGLEAGFAEPEDSYSDVFTSTWKEPGVYRIEFEVRDIRSDDLIDQSEVKKIVVEQKPLTPAATDSPERDPHDRQKPPPSRDPTNLDRELPPMGPLDFDKGQNPRGNKPGETDARIQKFFQSFATAAMALAFLMFPLVLTLATELHRGRPLTQSTIKPAFYAQCLYLSPFIVSIWIPILLSRYLPEPGDEYLLALLLAAVIFLWLVIAEVGFVRNERSISRFRAILWLFVPVTFVIASLAVVGFLAIQHKYAIVEYVGRSVMVLMLIPFIASGFVRLWRLVTRKSVESPFAHRRVPDEP